MFSVITLAVEFAIKALLNEWTLDSGKTEAIDIAFIGLFTLAFMYDLGHSKKIKAFSLPLFLGYIFRVALLLFDRYGQSIYLLPNSGGDSEAFYWKSQVVMKTGQAIERDAFPNLMGFIFSFIGPSRLYGQFITVLFSIVSLILFALLLNNINTEYRDKHIVCMIVCLLPNLAILSCLW